MKQGVYLPPMTQTNKYLIAILAIMFLVDSILKASSGIGMTPFLGLSPQGLGRGFLFQVATYPFVGRGLIEVLFNGLILWFVGCELEGIWGRKRYLSFLATAAFGGGVIFLALSYLIFGSSSGLSLTGFAGVTSALLLGYAILFPDRIFTFMLIFPMKAKYFCLLLIGIQLYMGFFSQGAVLAWGTLGTMASGVLFMFAITKLSGVKRVKRRKGHLSIVSDESDKPKYWH